MKPNYFLLLHLLLTTVAADIVFFKDGGLVFFTKQKGMTIEDGMCTVEIGYNRTKTTRFMPAILVPGK